MLHSGCLCPQEDTWLSHAISSLLGGDGVVIWGSTKSMESESLCKTLYSYINFFFGPFVKDFRDWTIKCSQLTCSGHGQCTAKNIPAELSFVSSQTRKQMVTQAYNSSYLLLLIFYMHAYIHVHMYVQEWMKYFKWLLSSAEQGTVLSEAYTCKCFPMWKGSDCSEQVYSTALIASESTNQDS